MELTHGHSPVIPKGTGWLIFRNDLLRIAIRDCEWRFFSLFPAQHRAAGLVGRQHEDLGYLDVLGG